MVTGPWRPLRSVPLLLVLLHVAAACLGVDGATRTGSAGASALLAIGVGMLVVLVCNADARSRGSALPHGMQYVMFLLWPIAGPVYLLQSRRAAGLVWIALWTTSLLMSAAAGVIVVVFFRALRGD